jgi:phage shock protein A
MSNIDRLLDEAEKAQRKGHLLLAEVCRDAADELGLVIEERNRLKGELEPTQMDADMQAREAGNMEYNARVLMTALEKALARLNEVEALRIGLDDECNRLRESLSIADAACRTYWGWEYGRPGDEDDDDIPDSSLLVKWRHDYVKRK